MLNDFTWMCHECRSPVSSADRIGRPGILKYAQCQVCGGVTRQSAEAIDGAAGSKVSADTRSGKGRFQG